MKHRRRPSRTIKELERWLSETFIGQRFDCIGPVFPYRKPQSRTFTIRYAANEPSLRDQILAAVREGKRDIRNDEMGCAGVKTLNKLARTFPFELFQAIVGGAHSIRAVSRIVDRKMPELERELSHLASYGVIRLKWQRRGRQRELHAKPLYSRIVFEADFDGSKTSAKRARMADGLAQGLVEALEHAQGRRALRARTVERKE